MSTTTMFEISKILVPIDSHECSRAAFDVAKTMAAKFGAEIVALHVVEEPREYGEWMIEPSTSGATHFGGGDLGRFSCEEGVRIEQVTLPGRPEVVILREAAERACGLIVMGTAGRRGIGRFILGSVAENVSRHAVCPVLLVKSAPSETVVQSSTATAAHK
jgi:nucleotide-binding universal stress UspA family protein